jgi:hypothetical protein
LRNDAFAGIPSAPGKLPNKLSNVWFSTMISMTCLIGEPGIPVDTVPACRACPVAAVAVSAVTAATTGTSPAAKSFMRLTRMTLARQGNRHWGDL